MDQVLLTAGSALTFVGLTALYVTAVALLARRVGLPLRSDESLALGLVAMCLVGSVGFLISKALSAVLFRMNGSLVTVPLSALVVVLLGAPLAMAVLLRGPRAQVMTLTRAPGALLRWAAPALVIAAVGAAVALGFGADNVFRSDATARTDATKELVWDNSSNVGNAPALAPEQRKYAGYLVTRATVTMLSGDDPWRPTFAWVALCAAGMAAALFALGRNLGLPWPAAAAAVATVPLLGGDAYRILYPSDARGVAITVAFAGLALLARELAQERPRRGVVASAGAIAGVAALVHVQYLVIVSSLLVPAVIVALLGRRWLGTQWRSLLVATAAAVAVMIVSLPQALSYGVSSVTEAASERSLTGPLATGASVWPPERVFLDLPLLYASPNLYILHPENLTDGVWGERTAPLLVVVAALAAVLLYRRRRATGLLPVLLLGSLLAPVLILFNPVVYPLFAKFFSTYRSEYVGFEFAFLGIGAILALLAHRALIAVPLAVAAVATAIPVVRATQEADDRHRLAVDRASAPSERALRELVTVTRSSDLLLADSPLYDILGVVPGRTSRTPVGQGVPSPLDPAEPPERVLELLRARTEPRIIIVLDRRIPPAAPLSRLVADGAVEPLPAADAPAGIYYKIVDLAGGR
jgi:hypothetical protein